MKKSRVVVRKKKNTLCDPDYGVSFFTQPVAVNLEREGELVPDGEAAKNILIGKGNTTIPLLFLPVYLYIALCKDEDIIIISF
ncbi:hypothetical protein ACJX0J_011829, partial [Zea mays]